MGRWDREVQHVGDIGIGQEVCNSTGRYAELFGALLCPSGIEVGTGSDLEGAEPLPRLEIENADVSATDDADCRRYLYHFHSSACAAQSSPRVQISSTSGCRMLCA